MEVSYATMIAFGQLVQRLGQDARRLEKALAETMNASAEWRRIADDLKAERNAERDAHTALKQALGVQAAKEVAKVLCMIEGEGLRGAAQRVVKERDALRAECDDLRRMFDRVYGSLVELKKERDDLRAQLATERERNKTIQPEASHDTPTGKQTAQAAITPQPGDMVRLVRVPTQQDYPMDAGTWLLDYGKPGECGMVEKPPHINCMGVAVVAMDNGWQWPLSCVEVVKGVDK